MWIVDERSPGLSRNDAGLAISSNQYPIHLLLDGLGPTDECCLKLLWLDAGDDPGMVSCPGIFI